MFNFVGFFIMRSERISELLGYSISYHGSHKVSLATTLPTGPPFVQDNLNIRRRSRGKNAKKIRENTKVEAAPLPGLGEAAREVLAHGLKEAARTMPRARHAQTHVRDACRRSLWKWIRDSEC